MIAPNSLLPNMDNHEADHPYPRWRIVPSECRCYTPPPAGRIDVLRASNAKNDLRWDQVSTANHG